MLPPPPSPAVLARINKTKQPALPLSFSSPCAWQASVHHSQFPSSPPSRRRKVKVNLYDSPFFPGGKHQWCLCSLYRTTPPLPPSPPPAVDMKVTRNCDELVPRSGFTGPSFPSLPPSPLSQRYCVRHRKKGAVPLFFFFLFPGRNRRIRQSQRPVRPQTFFFLFFLFFFIFLY